MKKGAPHHPKTRALARSLDVPLPYAVGLLEMLWHFTAEYAPQGDIGRFSDQQIAEAVHYDSEPSKLLDALVSCGWLDVHEEHRLVVHDWHDHADDSVRKRLARKGLDFVTRRPDSGGQCPQPNRTMSATLADNVGNPAGQCPEPTPTVSATLADNVGNPAAPSRSRSQGRSHSQGQSRQPEPEPAGARRAGNGTAGLPWLSAIETALADVVGRPPRPDTAVKLASAAASFGIHPRFVARWIVERNGSPPKSDGLFLSIVETDLVPWVRRQQYPRDCLPVDQARCPSCGGTITAFRDVVVPCSCPPIEHKPEPAGAVLSPEEATA